MSINQQHHNLRTPHRATNSNVQQQNPCNTFTPCTRLSRMTIESQSNGQQGRIRTAHFQQLPVSNFNDKLMQVVREEEQSSHPNLDMFLGADSRISFFGKSVSSSEEEEEEEEEEDQVEEEEEEESDEGGDLFFSSNLCPMSSPDRGLLTRQSIFDDERMHSPPPSALISVNKRSIFDDEDDEEEQEEQDEDMEQDVYDPSTAWLSQIYSDDITDDVTTEQPPVQEQAEQAEEEEEEEEEENIAPRHWHSSRQKELNEKIKRTILPQEEDNQLSLNNTRLPLREIRFETEEIEAPASKMKIITSQSGKLHKMRFMRSLSPPRFTTKRKGISSSSNSSNASSSASSLL